MKAETTVWIDGPADTTECIYQHDMAKIRVAGSLSPCAQIILPDYGFAPGERGEYLRSAARKLILLASEVDAAEHIDVEPDADVRQILGTAIA